MADAHYERPSSGGFVARSLTARVVTLVLRWEVALAAILLLGAILRFHGLEWDKHAAILDGIAKILSAAG